MAIEKLFMNSYLTRENYKLHFNKFQFTPKFL
jgi:hypothetical protein